MAGIGERTQLNTLEFRVGGMTCVNCQNRIERALARTDGVASAQVSYANGRARVEYDAQETDEREIVVVVEGLGYSVLPGRKKRKAGAGPGADGVSHAHGLDARRVVGILIIVVAAFFILRNLGFTTSFGNIPLAEDGMGYGLLFVIGLLTSVHCVAMCGGINISQCVPAGARTREHKGDGSFCAADAEHKKNRPLCAADAGADVLAERGSRSKVASATFVPSLKYNFARVCSYTAVGAVVGGVGSAISLSGDMKGLIQLIAGVFMVIMGLSMFGVLPGIGRIVPRMPRVFGDRIASAKSGGKGPIVVGLLNGLMPCGPLQAMQIFALSTGSPAQGALSMLCFSLGTVPLMFGLGALSSILGGRFTSRAMIVGAALVVFLGLFMFTQGLTLSGVDVPGGARSVVIARGAGADASSGGEGNLPAALTEGHCAVGAESGGSPSDGAGDVSGDGSGGVASGAGTGNDNDSAGAGGLSGGGTENDNVGVGSSGGTGANAGGLSGDGTDADGSYTDDEGNSYATEDGVQVVHSVLDRGGYPHITVKAGAPVRWIIDAPEGSVNGCNGAIYIPEYGLEHAFALGENVINFTPEKTGDFMYSCWMGMITSYITVEA